MAKHISEEKGFNKKTDNQDEQLTVYDIMGI